jgi:hypothetical protein
MKETLRESIIKILDRELADIPQHMIERITSDICKEFIKSKRNHDNDVSLSDEITNIKESINDLSHTDESDPVILQQWTKTTCCRLLSIIDDLTDENNSVWQFLDELKKSEIRNYSKEFQKSIDKKLLELQFLAMKEPEEA